MPLPIAHSLISATVYVAYKGGLPSTREDLKDLGLFVFAGLLPDIDFITVPFMGFGGHRGLTHSFPFVFAAAMLLYFLRKARGPASPRLFGFLLVTAALHPVCDYFTYDYLVERGGVKLFYPFSDEYFQSPFPLFIGIELRYLRTIFSAHTLLALGYETLVTGALLLITLYLKTGSIAPGQLRGRED